MKSVKWYINHRNLFHMRNNSIQYKLLILPLAALLEVCFEVKNLCQTVKTMMQEDEKFGKMRWKGK